MADVTINALTRGTPTGGNILPYSTGSDTLGVPVSALFHNAGNIGIGTVSPSYLLDLRQNYNGALVNIEGSSDNIAIRLKNNQAGGREYRIISTAQGSGYGAGALALEDQASGSARVVINNAGNVGIGTNTPQAKLDVNGDVKATSYKTGSLPMFGANAFVHFNGGLDINGNASTANTARRIYAGGNVSSVLRNALGLYTIYFNTAMTTTEYMAVCSARHYDGLTWDVHCEVSNRQTTSCVVNVQSNYAGSPGSTGYDSRDVDVMIIC